MSCGTSQWYLDEETKRQAKKNASERECVQVKPSNMFANPFAELIIKTLVLLTRADYSIIIIFIN